ncbi:prepilin-type N-terminal cleavage/methylation domain-containing protein [Archangium gephyra]|uniref:PilW family protein n=1 Tax=Archangium gephyra TaxID=48 RepID=UPI0035D44199
MVKGRRGFTLIELLVGSAVALTVLAVAFAAFVRITAMHRRQVELAEMKRSAALVLGQLGAELRQAGLGRPRHARAEGGAELFPPTFLVAQEHQLAFLTDLPRRDSNFNGYSQLADDQTTGLPANGIALLNELNGGCDISDATAHCSSNEESLLFAPDAGTDDCADSADAPTCPWGLNRYQGQEYLIVANQKGSWVERQLKASLHASVTGGRRTLVLETGLPADFLSGPNRGFVSTPDRVYYGLDAGGVRRNQCWGSIFSGGAFSLACSDTFTTTATGWEVLTTGVAPNGLRFSYWTANGTLLPVPVTDEVDLRGIRRVDIELDLERPLPDGETLRHSASLSITLRQ